MISSYAYLFVYHGSRDCRTQAAAIELKKSLIANQSKSILTQHNYLKKLTARDKLKSAPAANLSQPPLIEIAPLELATETLSDRLTNFARQACWRGLKQIEVVPLFLAPGVHVQSDIPTEIAIARKQIDCQVTIELSPYLGKFSAIGNLIVRQFDELSTRTRILVAHGSKLPATTEYYRNLSTQLNIDIAFWSGRPRFDQQIRAKIASGSKKIALLPYFLFPGRITSAIAAEIAELQQEFSQVELLLGKPLGATPMLAESIAREV